MVLSLHVLRKRGEFSREGHVMDHDFRSGDNLQETGISGLQVTHVTVRRIAAQAVLDALPAAVILAGLIALVFLIFDNA
jgi:hypothetical protein